MKPPSMDPNEKKRENFPRLFTSFIHQVKTCPDKISEEFLTFFNRIIKPTPICFTKKRITSFYFDFRKYNFQEYRSVGVTLRLEV